MQLTLHQVDAFTSEVFGGNPAAVVPLDEWIADDLMQAIATENNLSETAFFVPSSDGYDLRWFTPVAEVDLCGHATLASAWVVLTHLDPAARGVSFSTRSGRLTVTRDGDRLVMDFPSRAPVPMEPAAGLIDALGGSPTEVLKGPDWLVVYANEAALRALAPDFGALKNVDARGVIVSAPGDEVDFVSRFFAPKFGVDEDPVTGSAHCTLVPYWAKRLGRDELHARQISARGGTVWCVDRGDRVELAGHAVGYLEGTIDVGVATPV